MWPISGEELTGFALGSAASMLVTFGMGLQLFKSKVKDFTKALETVLAREQESAKSTTKALGAISEVLREATRVLKSLDDKHSPERADGAGFGTVWLRKPLAGIETALTLLLRDMEAGRAEQVKAHEQLMVAIERSAN